MSRLTIQVLNHIASRQTRSTVQGYLLALACTLAFTSASQAQTISIDFLSGIKPGNLVDANGQWTLPPGYAFVGIKCYKKKAGDADWTQDGLASFTPKTWARTYSGIDGGIWYFRVDLYYTDLQMKVKSKPSDIKVVNYGP